MKRKKFTVLKVTLTAMMLTAALTFGAGSAYAADLPQEGGSEPTVTITPSPEVTPELLIECGLVKKELNGIKILGQGELEKQLTVKANKFSKSAVAVIENAGGKAEVI